MAMTFLQNGHGEEGPGRAVKGVDRVFPSPPVKMYDMQ